MEFNVSDTSLAFSDVVGPSHVSGLESFSDFDVGSEYDQSFEDQEAHDSGVEEESVTPQPVDSTQNVNKDAKDERSVQLCFIRISKKSNEFRLNFDEIHFTVKKCCTFCVIHCACSLVR